MAASVWLVDCECIFKWVSTWTSTILRVSFSALYEKWSHYLSVHIFFRLLNKSPEKNKNCAVQKLPNKQKLLNFTLFQVSCLELKIPIKTEAIKRYFFASWVCAAKLRHNHEAKKYIFSFDENLQFWTRYLK